MSVSEASAEPYKGPLYYDVDDRDLFFGRGTDVFKISSLIAGSRLTLLHAPSGAGKTSLIRAGLVPRLEAEGLDVVVCRPGLDPSRAVRSAVLTRLLPDPSVEREAHREIVKTLAPNDREEVSLADLKLRYRQLRPHAPAYRRLVAETSAIRESSLLEAEGAPERLRPAIARYLYLPAGAPSLVAQFARLEAKVDPAERRWPWPSTLRHAAAFNGLMREWTAKGLDHFLADGDLQVRYNDTIQDLATNDESLIDFFTRVSSAVSPAGETLEVVLILDQFEEFFTRFGDTKKRWRDRSKDAIDYEIREAFFAELGKLLGYEESVAVGAAARCRVRVLISMRDDFIAQLDQLERYTGRIAERSRHHLDPLRSEGADDIIREPARTFGYDYAPELSHNIRDELTEEGRYLEPGHLQIVCSRLWEEYGKKIHEALLKDRAASEEADLTEEAAGHVLTLSNLEDLGGVYGILENHFKRFLEAQENELDRFEILDMLSLLVTPNHTRSIVFWDELTGAWFARTKKSSEGKSRDQPIDKSDAVKSRDELLETLRDKRMIRLHSLGNKRLVEVAHEFLIRPIEEALKSQEPHWRQLKSTLEWLEKDARGPGFRSFAARTTEEQLEALYWYRHRLNENEIHAWLAELLFRACALAVRDPDRKREMLEHWGKWVDDKPIEIDGHALAQAEELNARSPKNQQRWLDGEELRALVDAHALCDLPLDERVRDFVVASAVRNGSRAVNASILAYIQGSADVGRRERHKTKS